MTAVLEWTGREHRFVEPKTDRARRTIALPPFAVQALRRWHKDQAKRRLLAGPDWQDLGLVLDGGDGRPLRTDSVSSGFAELIERAGLPHVRFHDLRHAYATALLKANIHPKVASEALGHSSVAFTLDTYSHVIPSMGQQAAEAIEAALAGQVASD